MGIVMPRGPDRIRGESLQLGWRPDDLGGRADGGSCFSGENGASSGPFYELL